MIRVTARKQTYIEDLTIAYCLTDKGVIEIGLKDNTKAYIRMALKQLAADLPHLIQTGNKALVSPDMVEDFSNQTITLLNGKKIPVSRGWKKHVKERLRDFNMENESDTD